MDIEGDIEVWTEGDNACARLKADTPEGPLVLQASAPLAPIRRRVAMAYARRGIEVSGEDPGYQATVKRLARRKALRRLSMVAPAAFKRGGLASYVARRQLAKRNRQRLRLAHAGKPVGDKPIGTLPPGTRRTRRRRRRWAFAKKPRILGRLTALAPELVSAVPRAEQAALPAATPSGASDGGSAPGSTPAAAPTTAADEEPAPADEEAPAEEASPEEEAPAEEAEETADQGDGDDGDGADDTPPEESADDSDGEAADVGGDLEPVHLQPGHVRAAAALLMAARRHPAARRRVQQIVQLAGEGDSIAKKAVKALKAAKNLVIRTKVTRRPPAPLPPVPKPKAVKRRVVPAPAPARLVAQTPASSWRRWFDIFASWRQGVG